MTDFKFLDSSILVAYLTKGLFAEIIESENPFAISSLSIFEVKRKFLRDGISLNEAEKAISLIKERVAHIFVADETTAQKAAELSFTKKLPALDSLIYASALINNSELLTTDNDFRGLDKVKVL